MEKEIVFGGRHRIVSCDGKCNKAWGITHRPKIQLSECLDDIVHLSDDELGDAPENPGTYEGEHAKPYSVDEFPNKWCVRECERSFFVGEQEPPDFSRRVYNMPHLHKDLVT